MKKLLKGIGLITICLTLVGCNSKQAFIEIKEQERKEITKSTAINDKDGDYTIYYYGINEANVTIDNQKYDLADSLLNNKITLKEIFNNQELLDSKTEIYKDGGTKKYLTKNYSIIKCNTLSKNNDIYIGNTSMEYEDNFCSFDENTKTNIELLTEVTLKSSIDNDGNHIDNNEELINYNVYIKDKKLYATKIDTNEEKIIFDKEEVKNIAIRPICCTGNGNLLILTTSGDVYISENDCNYFFSFNFPFKKLEVKDIVSFKLIPINKNDLTKNLYGVNSKGEEILLQKLN